MKKEEERVWLVLSGWGVGDQEASIPGTVLCCRGPGTPFHLCPWEELTMCYHLYKSSWQGRRLSPGCYFGVVDVTNPFYMLLPSLFPCLSLNYSHIFSKYVLSTLLILGRQQRTPQAELPDLLESAG